MGILPGISEVLLPQDDLNVLDFIDFVIPLGKHTPDLLAMGLVEPQWNSDIWSTYCLSYGNKLNKHQKDGETWKNWCLCKEKFDHMIKHVIGNLPSIETYWVTYQ